MDITLFEIFQGNHETIFTQTFLSKKNFFHFYFISVCKILVVILLVVCYSGSKRKSCDGKS